MKLPRLTPLLIVPFLLWGAGANAEKADRDKTMNVESDALRYDDAKKVSVFSGRVVLTKGTILIRGAVLTVRQDPDGAQHGVVSAEPGKLAFFRQKREGVDEFVEGEGETIEYDGRAETVRLLKQAQLRRYRGATLSDEMTGALIVYNNATDVFTVDGSAARGSPGAAGGRVRAMLTPKARTDESPPAGPAPTLKSTPALGGDPK
ncbi:lipopolysaccharide transport periplasmic protein LptA [Rhodoferax sp.]|uniref:lipopolysaccharide transport periplasmic protein LptA n=1 Tax=Rhodoferax sp. TaxID=50421 RepID=UPI0027791FBC|nr:lipopolysaccharide transport periplasmic protein LptA [Rhodoferax sp.]